MKTRIAALLLTALILPACDVRPTWDGFPTTGVNAVQLGGSQVVPAVTTVATGSATLTVDGHDTAVDYSVSESGIGTPTAVRIHLGAPGTNGPALFTLTTGAFTSPLTGTLTSADLTPAPAQGIATFADAVAALKTGGTYLLISSAANPSGELRGQLGAVTVASAVLTGAQMVPVVAGTGTGTATVQLSQDQTEISVTVTFAGLAGAAVSTSIYEGAAGATGPVLFTVASGSLTSPVTATLTVADFTPGVTVLTFEDMVNALLSGTLYIDVDTLAAPGSEIRGQLGPVQMSASLTGGSVVFPLSSSTNTGTATVTLNGMQTAVNVLLNHNVGAATGVLIHAEAVGVNGPQIFDVATASGGSVSPVSAVLTAGNLIPQAVQSILTFTDAVDALIVGRTYIDVSSSAFPAGEIRGQIVP